jgi:hypothetical protein
MCTTTAGMKTTLENKERGLLFTTWWVIKQIIYSLENQ